MIGGVPRQGGATWAVLQYLLGFKRLGHHVYFVEPVAPTALVPAGVSLEQSCNGRYFHEVMRTFGLADVSALQLAGSRETIGLPYADLCKVSRQADLLVNISGLLTDELLLAPIPVRLYLDLDPAFTQLWHFTQGIDVRLDGHTHYATVGLAIGGEPCSVPTGGLDWIPTLPPVVLEHWPRVERVSWQALTTVAHWRGYGSIELAGVHYGQKAHSVRRLLDLPRRCGVRCVLALEIHPDEVADLERLAANQWELVDPASVTATPDSYRAFVGGSWAELGFAKSGYAVSRSGWFSDRSVCYLACGRPVIAQDTGFSHWLPTGRGLFAFETTADAVAAVDEVRRAYDLHARAARELAETRFDSDKVLTSLLDRLGSSG
jgi:hypothetical protein